MSAETTKEEIELKLLRCMLLMINCTIDFKYKRVEIDSKKMRHYMNTVVAELEYVYSIYELNEEYKIPEGLVEYAEATKENLFEWLDNFDSNGEFMQTNSFLVQANILMFSGLLCKVIQN